MLSLRRNARDGMVTTLGAGQPRNRGSVTGKTKRRSPSSTLRPAMAL